MQDKAKTNEELLLTVQSLRQEVVRLQAVATQHRQTEQALRESEEKYRTLFEASTDAVFLETLDGCLLDCNTAACEMLGYTKEELLGLTVVDLVPEHVAATLPDAVSGVLTTGGIFVETENKRKNGTVFPVEVSTRLVNLEGEERVIIYVHDITERVRTQEALRRRAEELETLQATVLDIIAQRDLPTLLETIVERAARLLGAPSGGLYLCEPDRQQVRCVVSYKTPSDYRGVVLNYGEGAAGAVAQTGQPLILDDYGAWENRAPVYEEERPFKSVVAAPMVWQDQVIGVIDIVHYAQGWRFDQAGLELLSLFANHAAIAVVNARLYEQAREEIAKRRDLERQTEERRVYLESVLACAPDAIVTLDADHRVLEWNQGAENLFGYSADEARGQELDLLIAKPNAQIFKEAVGLTRKVLAGHQVLPTETIRYRKDGSPVHVILAGAPIWIGDRQVGTAAVYTDITQRKQADEELRQLKEFNENIVQNMAEGIAIQNVEGLFTFVNPAAAALLGYTPEELTGQHWTLVVPPDQQPIVAAADERRERGEADRYEVELLRKDGARITVLISGSPRFKNGHFDGTLAVFTDLTERVKAEEQVRQRTAQLEALRRTGLELAAQLDLGELLRSIVSRAVEMVGGTSGGLYLHRPARDVLEWTMGVGPHMGPTGTILRRGEGLSGRVWETGEPLIVDDYRHWEGRAAVHEGFPRSAVVGVPVCWGEEFLGVVNVLADAPHTFSSDDAELLSLLTTQAAIAIKNARLFHETKQRLNELTLLFDTGAAISTSLEVETVVNATGEQITRALSIEECTIYTWERERDAIVCLYDYSPDRDWWHPEPPGTVYPLADYPVSRQALVERCPIVLQASDPETDPAELAWMTEQEVQSVLMVPMVVRDEPIGLLEVMQSTKRGERVFTTTEIAVCQTLANQAAAALENARLFQAEREQRELAEALRQAAAAVSSTLDLDEVLDRILDQVNRVIPGDTSNIMLIEGERVRVVRWHGYERFGGGELLKSVAFEVAETPTLRQMAETGKPVIISETVTYDEWVYVSEWIRSYAGAPIRAGERVIGFLNVNSASPGFFRSFHTDLMQAFANQASVALQNARLFRETSRHAEQMDTLHQIGMALTADLELDEVLNTLYRELEPIVDIGAFYVALYDEESGLIHFPLLTGINGPGLVEPLHIEQRPGITGYVISSRQTLYVPDSRAVPDDAPYHYIPLTEMPARSYIGVPLIARNQVIGVFSVQSYEPYAYTQDDVEFLTTIASQATIAIENARMYDQARRRNRDLALLNRIIAASAASQQIETILETVCRELALAFDVPQSAAALFNEEKTKAVVVAEYLAEGRPHSLGEVIPAVDNPSSQHLIRQKTPLVVENAQTDPRLAPIHELMRQRGTVSLLLLPLSVGGEVVGSLGVDATEHRPFSADEVDLAQRVAEQMSGALARARLEETQRRLSAAVEQAAEAVLITDTEGYILYVNPAFERITGYGRDEIIGQKPDIFQSGEHDDTFYRDLWQTVVAGQVWQGRFTNRRKDGSLFTEDATISPVRNQAGQVVNFVATMRDVTREVQLEEQFYHAQKMEALGQMAGGIAHDFNNLLTILQLSTRLMKKQLRSADPLWEHVQRIQETGERAAKLTKQLLSFSRREVVNLQMLDLSQVVAELSSMLQRIIGEDIQLVTLLADDLWPLEMDPSQLDQVIMNLVVNARDAIPGVGTLTIETRNVQLDETYAASHVDAQPGEHVLLAITDTGMGMTDEVKSHLFEPFFTTKERGQGTGLGLPTVFGIVKQNGGHIWVQSQVGKGTTVNVYLPSAREAKAQPQGAPAPVSPVQSEPVRGAETILVVEDEHEVRELAVQVLQSCGYRVLAAANGPEALRLSEEHPGPIHLLLTDVVMPQMNGKDLADRLLAQRSETRVLFMSGYADGAVMKHGVVPQGTSFLSKPLTVEGLAHKVREVLDGQL